ncbi:MAG: cache domain-containing protein [Dehalococcoidales bacterium]|nr:cache domain-containing protein [Dehalococcoidales bacterium]
MSEKLKQIFDLKQLLKLNLQTKILALGIVIIAAFIGVILGYMLPGVQDSIMTERENKIQEETQIAWGIIDSCYQQQSLRVLSEKDAKAEAIRLLRGLRYGPENTDYFWINDYRPYMIMDPYKIALQGSDLSAVTDPSGRTIFVEMVDICAQQGEGLISYTWQYLDDNQRQEEKISYVKAFEPWEWIVGTGVYTVDIQQVIDAQRNQYLLVAGIMALICFALIYFLTRPISRNIKRLASVADKLAIGDTKQKVKVKSSDETGELAESLTNVINYLWETSQVAEKIAEGDLTVQVTPKSENDTLAKSFNKMVTNLKLMIEDVRQKISYLNQIPNTILVVDTDYNILFVNRVAARAAGKKAEECVGKKCYDLFSTADCKTEECGCAKAFQTNKVITKETTVKLSSGEIPVRYTCAPIKDADGKVIGATEYVLDISKEKAAVARMTEISESLSKASEELKAASEQSGSATEQIASVSQQVARGAEEQTRGINEVNRAIDELEKSIGQVDKGSKDQAKAVEQTAGIVQQVSSAAEQTAASAQEAANVAGQAAEVAKQGTETVEKTIAGIRQINTSMQDVANKVAELGKHSEEIGGMIAVIDDIAAQTNLLALNAAIEAARAGDQGRGFAVVADEVKKLAERTAKETKEIATLVSSVQKGVNESIKASMEGAKQAEEGSVLANEAGTALDQILDSINGMTSQIEQISAAAEEMSASSSEMVKVVEEVSMIAEENLNATKQMSESKTKVSESANTVAATTEENSAATEQMSASAQEMSAQVQQVVTAAQSLSKMASDLKDAINLFELRNRDTIGKSKDKDAAESESGSGNGKKSKPNIKNTVEM